MLCFILGIAIVVAVIAYRNYTKTSYYVVTKTSPIQLCFDKGKLGEYLTYKHLCSAEKKGAKFLFNIYIPKGEEKTTEIDVLMIHAKGLFVFESKNYSGWIFGSEHQKNWYQTLPQGRGRSHKESFYNPIMQNRTHIKHLKALIGEDIPTHSVITFSERCTLKKVDVKSDDIRVIKRDKVYDTVAAICAKRDTAVLTNEQISEIYERLYPYTQVSIAIKEQHIENIEKPKEFAELQPVGERFATEQEKRCPRCNSVLVLRTATKGANAGKQFYGCSSFPKCRYMENLDRDALLAEGEVD